MLGGCSLVLHVKCAQSKAVIVHKAGGLACDMDGVFSRKGEQGAVEDGYAKVSTFGEQLNYRGRANQLGHQE